MEDRPRIEWAARNVLRVTVPNLSILKILATQVGDVHIDVRYDPDDPEARAAWRKGMEDQRWQLDAADAPAPGSR